MNGDTFKLPDPSSFYPPDLKRTTWMPAGPPYSGWAASDVLNAAPANNPSVSPSSKDGDLYKYATLLSLLGMAGGALGQAFRPWFGPPPPIAPHPPRPPEVTAPALLQYLASTRQRR